MSRPSETSQHMGCEMRRVGILFGTAKRRRSLRLEERSARSKAEVLWVILIDEIHDVLVVVIQLYCDLGLELGVVII